MNNLFKINPTIRETNKYLNEIVRELLKKHGQVSSEEFEKELIAITGISYKQVKNYKNDPKPNRRLKDNAIVLKFVRERRKKDAKKRAAILSLKVVIILTLIGFAIHNWPTKEDSKVFIVDNSNSVVDQHINDSKLKTANFHIKMKLPQLDWMLRLGPIENSDFDLDKFECISAEENLKSCAYKLNNNDLSVSILISESMIERYSISTYNSSNVENLESQVNELIKGLQRVENNTTKAFIYKSDYETIQFEKSVWEDVPSKPEAYVINARLNL